MNQASRFPIVLLAMISLLFVFHGRAEKSEPRESSPAPKPLYDSDPNHLWNRLYATLFIRAARDGTEYGFDSLDPLYWSVTKHLLDGESHAQAIRVLDEFIGKHGEKLITDPLKRAMLQRDLWALFDWAVTRNRYEQVPFHEAEIRALSARLAKVIRRLALTKEQIQSLPDNYAAAVASKAFPEAFDPEKPDASFLPPDLLKDESAWVCIETTRGLPAPIHTREFGGRSAFAIFVNLPGGRAATLAYLQKLNDFAEPWIFDKALMEQKRDMLSAMPHSFDPKRGPWVNPDMPQFPDGTKFALVRQAVLIDSEGNPAPTHVPMSVQMRVYREINPVHSDGGEQAVFEFKLQLAALFAYKVGGLHAVKKDEEDFNGFLVQGSNYIEMSTRDSVLNCMNCHKGAGIHSVLSHSQLFSYPKTLQPPKFEDSDLGRIRDSTAGWKRDQFSWGLLKGLWQQGSQESPPGK